VVLIALWALTRGWRRDVAALRLPATRAFAALLLAVGLAAAVGNLPWFGFGRTAPIPAQLGGLAVFLVSAGVFVLAADELCDPRWLQRVTWVFFGLAAVFIAGYRIPELDNLRVWLIQRKADGSLSWTWFAALATAQALFNRSLHWRWRLLLAVAVIGQLTYGLGEGRPWASGWLPPLVAIVAVACAGAPRFGACVIAAGIGAALLKLPRVIGIVMAGDNRYSLDTRLEAWRIMARVAAANPLLGLGPANYYHVTPLFPIRGYAVNFSSHSTYVDLLVESGCVGLICFAWLAWALARAGWRLRSSAPAGFARAYAIGALGGLVGTLAAGALGDWVFPFVYNVTLEGLRSSLIGWLFLGGLLALGRRLPDPARAPGRWRWSTARGLLVIVAAAVSLRVAVALLLGDTASLLPGAADQVSYDTLAQRVVAGYGFSFPTPWYPFTEPDTPTAHWSFLYTLYLAAIYALVGHHPLVARLVQAIISGGGCWLVFRIGRRLFDERVGLAAAALSALYAYFIYFGAALMTQAFYIVALLASIDRALEVVARPRAGAWAALGVSLGIGVLLRQTLLLYVPFLLAWLAWTTRGRMRWRDAALAVGLLATCVLPWTARNYAVFHDFLLLNANGGYFLYASNHPDQGTHFDPNFTAPIPADLAGTGEPAIDRALTRAALGFIAAEPARFLRLAWSRAGSYFWMTPSTESSPISNLARLCSFTLAAPLMLYGLACSRRRWQACVPLYLYLLVDAALHLASWSAPRYRLPSDALLMVFAGLAAVDLARRVGWLPAAATIGASEAHGEATQRA
jgi:4-amino-4-deoxy-L-arabinose transferase-like glycosyltransferase